MLRIEGNNCWHLFFPRFSIEGGVIYVFPVARDGLLVNGILIDLCMDGSSLGVDSKNVNSLKCWAGISTYSECVCYL